MLAISQPWLYLPITEIHGVMSIIGIQWTDTISLRVIHWGISYMWLWKLSQFTRDWNLELVNILHINLAQSVSMLLHWRQQTYYILYSTNDQEDPTNQNVHLFGRTSVFRNWNWCQKLNQELNIILYEINRNHGVNWFLKVHGILN